MMNMPPVTKNLIIINVLFFLGKMVAVRYGVDLDNLLGLHFFFAPDFRFYQLVTYMFMHGGITHILFNMFAVWMFGRVMESYWGSRRFLIYYFVCGIGAGLVQEGVQYIYYLVKDVDSFAYAIGEMDGNKVINWRLPDGPNLNIFPNERLFSIEAYLNAWTTIGASGAVYGILLAFGMSFPNEQMFVFPLPVPIKAKFFVIGYAAIELWLALNNSGDGVAHFAHLGGMIFGLLLILYWRNNRGGGYYGRDSFGQKMKEWFFNQRDRFSSYRRPKMKVSMGDRKDDYEYNARKRTEEEEIDRILEKVRKSGYSALTDDEKRKLFDASQR